MMELRGKAVAESITAAASESIKELKQKGVSPKLAVIRVGKKPDDLAYERGILKRFGDAGCDHEVFELDIACSQKELDDVFDRCNSDKDIHGILVFRPLPKNLSDEHMRKTIDPDKDIDAMGTLNQASLYAGDPSAYAPCTAKAVMELIKFYDIPLTGKRVTVVGRSLVIGKPVALMLTNANATVTVCHTKTQDLASELKRADIIVSAAGAAKMIKADMVGEGQIIIDVGVDTDDEGKMSGDVDYAAVAPKADMITPVPGGVGAVTTSILLSYTVEGAKRTLNG
ncbi:MAG: bifunctional 5,10-methylenetetrahydrofolate dehydrogenase/5,10-methenyltetrahydrofolate cyclohydrolase [Clostridiales bacterium]|nr:bifunctional 5,10-methylenetetrahydrofolate dehydrogenase/5,10-methenyltetrahydrofolate cyclohydrolase [Clostridiales bacterium]